MWLWEEEGWWLLSALGFEFEEEEEEEEEVRAEITSPRAESDPLIAAASFKPCPSDPDFFSRSLPARSTNASFPLDTWLVWRLRVETWMVTTRCDLDDAAFIFFLFFVCGFFQVFESVLWGVSFFLFSFWSFFSPPLSNSSFALKHYSSDGDRE